MMLEEIREKGTLVTTSDFPFRADGLTQIIGSSVSRPLTSQSRDLLVT